MGFVPYSRAALMDQRSARLGQEIPESMDLLPLFDSGFFFGRVAGMGPNEAVMKPADEDGHELVVGGPGSYKTSGMLVPTLASWKGIIITIDIKQNHLFTKAWLRYNGHTGKRLKVFRPASEGGCSYDPFAFLRDDGEGNLVRNARELALALLPMPPEIKDPFWRKGAQNILTAAILYYFDLGATFIETMIGIQTSTAEELLAEIEESDCLAAKMCIKRLQGVRDEMAESVAMDLADLISFATDPMIWNAFDPDNPYGVFDWSYLNAADKPFDVILEIPEDKLEQWAPMTTLMINQLIKTLERRPEKHSRAGRDLSPVLIMLDEFPRLGKIDAIRSGLATLRSRGVTFCLVIQFLSQLDELYGRDARRIIVGGCSYKAILNASEPEDQKYFADMLGEIIVQRGSLSRNLNPHTHEAITYSQTVSETREPLIYPSEFATLKDIILMTPTGFYRVEKSPYFDKNSPINPPPPLTASNFGYSYKA